MGRGVLVVVLVGCGRLGFSPLSGVADDTSGDGSVDSSGDDGGTQSGDGPPGSTKNVVFVTSTKVAAATLGGIQGADDECAARATAAGLAGTYVAWLSTSTVNARDRLGTWEGWSRTDDGVVFNKVSDLVAGRLWVPIRTDEFGTKLADDPTDVVWTATGADGMVAGATCGDFTSGTGQATVGRPFATAVRWTNATTLPCTATARLYCFGTGHNNSYVGIALPGGRFAFLALGWQPGMGINDADRLCQDSANLVSAPGMYSAFVATPTASAASRFLATGGNWHSFDYDTLAASPAALFAGDLRTSLNRTIYGTYPDVRVWTGAAGDATAPNSVPSTDQTCNNWRDSAPTTGGFGFSSETASMFFDGRTTATCDQSYGVYCLQE